jgi:YD repeat-containing protein
VRSSALLPIFSTRRKLVRWFEVTTNPIKGLTEAILNPASLEEGLMAKILLILGLVCMFTASAFGETVSVRDRSGKLIRTEKTNGDTTVVRDPQGKLIEKRVRQPGGQGSAGAHCG